MNLRKLTSGLCQAKDTERYWEVYYKDEPLVSICMNTYNRADLLLKYSLPSVIAQTYKNIEIIVVGDGCTDETEEGMKFVCRSYSNIKFVNLPENGPYPLESLHRWMVAGTFAVNKALEMATGDFITHLDHDDAYVPDKVMKLVDFIKDKKCDVVFHPFHLGTVEHLYHNNPSPRFEHGMVTTGSVFYHNWFKRITWDLDAWKQGEPGDWNRYKKFIEVGATINRHSDHMLIKR